jgi:hypothetical protein
MANGRLDLTFREYHFNCGSKITAAVFPSTKRRRRFAAPVRAAKSCKSGPVCSKQWAATWIWQHA